MANFTTHIAVGTIAAGALATITLAADVIAPENLVAVTMAGVLGSVLPDIDLKESRPSRAMFAGLAIFFSFAVLFSFATKYSIAELWVLWLGTLILVRYGLHNAFHHLAVHRGIWHSLLAGAFLRPSRPRSSSPMCSISRMAWLGSREASCSSASWCTSRSTRSTRSTSWIRASSPRSAQHSSSTTAAIPMRRRAWRPCLALAIFVAPSPTAFVDGMSSRPMWTALNQRLLPEGNWFGLGTVWSRTMRAAPLRLRDITTGTLPGGKRCAADAGRAPSSPGQVKATPL